MSISNQPRFSLTNRLLSDLPPRQYKRLAPYLERVSLDSRQVLHQPNEPIKQVYFPDNAVIPIVSRLKDGRTVKAGIVGSEGVVGIRALFGGSSTPYQYITLIRGNAHRIKARVLKAEFQRGGTLQDLLLRYTHVRLIQFAQISACNCLHNTLERLCRWLLMVHDRAMSDELSLTQEAISGVLRVRRTGISEVVGKLQKKKLIDFHYGQITILDRRGLEKASCECYGILTQG